MKKYVIIALIVLVGGIAIGLSLPRQSSTPAVKGAPDLSNSPYLTVNGVTEWYMNVPMRSGISTTTVCSAIPPVASSTLQYVSVRFGNFPYANVHFDIGTSTTAAGTSSALVSNTTIGTSTAAGYIASAFATSKVNSNQWVNVVMDALATTTGGYCQFEFTQY